MQARLNEDPLALAFTANDVSAFDALYSQYRGASYRYFVRQVPARTIAERLFVETWLAAIDARATFVAGTRFACWLFQFAHRSLLEYRRDSGSLDDGGEADGDWVDAEGRNSSLGDLMPLLDRPDFCASIVAAVENLPAAEREVFALVAEAELTVEEIAKVTGVSQEVAGRRLNAASARLKCVSREWRP